jgi:hypothetical protein
LTLPAAATIIKEGKKNRSRFKMLARHLKLQTAGFDFKLHELDFKKSKSCGQL